MFCLKLSSVEIIEIYFNAMLDTCETSIYILIVPQYSICFLFLWSFITVLTSSVTFIIYSKCRDLPNLWASLKLFITILLVKDAAILSCQYTERFCNRLRGIKCKFIKNMSFLVLISIIILFNMEVKTTFVPGRKNVDWEGLWCVISGI